MRYELFNRLNTSSSPLKEQEIRNCVLNGDLNNLLIELAKNTNFISIMKPSEKQKEEMFLEEMILRYFAVKTNYKQLYITKDIKHYLTEFMKEVNSNNFHFDYEKEKKDFLKIVDFLHKNNLSKPFRSLKGKFSASVYEVMMFVIDTIINKNDKFKASQYRDIKNKILNDEDFKRFAGEKTSQKDRLKNKMKRVEEILND
jgi:hypothetical protein